MSQSRKHSAFEAVANVGAGVVVSMVANATVLPAVGLAVSLEQNVVLTVVYTAISLVRSYVLRRTFNAMRTR